MPETSTACLPILFYKKVMGGSCFGAKLNKSFLRSYYPPTRRGGGVYGVLIPIFIQERNHRAINIFHCKKKRE